METLSNTNVISIIGIFAVAIFAIVKYWQYHKAEQKAHKLKVQHLEFEKSKAAKAEEPKLIADITCVRCEGDRYQYVLEIKNIKKPAFEMEIKLFPKLVDIQKINHLNTNESHKLDWVETRGENIKKKLNIIIKYKDVNNKYHKSRHEFVLNKNYDYKSDFQNLKTPDFTYQTQTTPL